MFEFDDRFEFIYLSNILTRNATSRSDVPTGKSKRAFSLDKTLLRWAITDSNRRPSACKADALNQLS